MKKLLFLAVLAASLLSTTGFVSNHVLGKGQKFFSKKNAIPGRYIVVLDEDKVGRGLFAPTIESDAQYLASIYGGGEVKTVYASALKGFVIEMPQEQAMAMSEDENVLFVEQDSTISVESTQANPQWNLDRIDQRNMPLNGAFDYNTTGAGVHAYILDTGIRASHVEFGGRASADYDNIGDGQNGNDCNGHGTHVAGIIGSSSWGVAKNVRLHGVRVIPCGGNGQLSNLLAGVDWVSANHQSPAVANISLTAAGTSPAIDTILTNAINTGVTYVVAAGNGAQDACGFTPASTPAAITVGASDENDLRALYSNYGSCIDIFAPGNLIVSTWNSSDTATHNLSGTSMAAPMVAGVAALYLESHPTASPSSVTQALLNSATNGVLTTNDSTSPNKLLYSWVNGAAPTPTPTATPTPTPTPTATPTPTPHSLRVTIRKRVQGTLTESGTTTAFPYSAVNLSTNSFQLQNNQDYIDPSVQESTPQNPIVVQESSVGGWQLMSINCVDTAGGTANSTVDLVNHKVSVVGTSGQQIECTFVSQQLAPTAGRATVSGRVIDSRGFGLRGLSIALFDPLTGGLKWTMTNPFGYYFFNDVVVGRTYVVMAPSTKRYRILNETRTINVNQDLIDIDFQAGSW